MKQTAPADSTPVYHAPRLIVYPLSPYLRRRAGSFSSRAYTAHRSFPPRIPAPQHTSRCRRGERPFSRFRHIPDSAPQYHPATSPAFSRRHRGFHQGTMLGFSPPPGISMYSLYISFDPDLHLPERYLLARGAEGIPGDLHKPVAAWHLHLGNGERPDLIGLQNLGDLFKVE